MENEILIFMKTIITTDFQHTFIRCQNVTFNQTVFFLRKILKKKLKLQYYD